MRILSINGSGTGGYRAAKFLSYLEKEIDKPLHEVFDMITGVSSGSIVAASLALGWSCEETIEKFKEFIPKIFKEPVWWITKYFKALYKIENLIDAIKINFDFPMSDMKTNFMTYALPVDDDFIEGRHWKSWKDKDMKIYHALISSCCAPSYFKPYKFKDNNGIVEKELNFVDGGLVSNNPSMCALVEAVKLGSNLQNIIILNIGSGKDTGKDASRYGGLLSVASTAIFDSLSASERVDEYQGKYLLGDNSINVYPDRMTKIDEMNLSLFDEQALNMWENKKDDIIKKLK